MVATGQIMEFALGMPVGARSTATSLAVDLSYSGSALSTKSRGCACSKCLCKRTTDLWGIVPSLMTTVLPGDHLQCAWANIVRSTAVWGLVRHGVEQKMAR